MPARRRAPQGCGPGVRRVCGNLPVRGTRQTYCYSSAWAATKCQTILARALSSLRSPNLGAEGPRDQGAKGKKRFGALHPSVPLRLGTMAKSSAATHAWSNSCAISETFYRDHSCDDCGIGPVKAVIAETTRCSHGWPPVPGRSPAACLMSAWITATASATRSVIRFWNGVSGPQCAPSV
jgi:hypothetical protein